SILLESSPEQAVNRPARSPSRAPHYRVGLSVCPWTNWSPRLRFLPGPSEEEKMKDEYHNHRKKTLSFLLTFLSLVLLLSGITARAQTQQVIDPVIDPVQDVLPAP